MELNKIKQLKESLKQGDVIEFSNEEDQLLLSFNSVTNNFRITLNGSLIKTNKMFLAFVENVSFLIDSKNLKITE